MSRLTAHGSRLTAHGSRLILVVVLAALWTNIVNHAAAQSPAPIRYTVRFPEPQTHIAEVEAVYPTEGRADLDLMMAVWTPGSYLVREYARNVGGLSATDAQGRSLKLVKTRKNRWRVTTGGAPAIVVRYNIYCREMSVRTNWVEDRFAMLNGAPTFITLLERSARPHDILLELPSAWHTSLTTLPAAPDGRPHHYLAPDYDTVVDSPILAGNPSQYSFTVAGASFTLVNEGEAGVWDGAASARDVEAIVRAAERIWRGMPFDRYLMFNMITEGGGGLEHRDSTLLMTNRWRTRNRSDYIGWLGLASHEFFHAWNGKRLRPVELGPFDYENEVHTENLWVYEGFTEYYDNLVLRRAGLISDAEYLNELSNTIRSLQTTPGRDAQTAGEASFDAWIRYYRPDENSPNVSISYYTKGAVVAFLLDARIRQATGGAKSLDDVMRLAYSRFSGPRGYSTDEFRKAAAEVVGADLGPWFAVVADGTGEVSYEEALRTFGLRFKPVAARSDGAWLGARTRVDGGRLIVSELRRGTPAAAGGLDVDDEIIAIDDFRVRADQLQNRLERYRPGQRVEVLVARRDQLMRIPVTLGMEPADAWQLEADPSANAAQQEQRNAWLKGQ
ncbi:MAG: M61 family metallopeptidase [Vicinamibacterales bacterium]